MSALVSTSPADIVNAARCFISCVPVSQRLALKTYLLTQFGNAATPPCVTPTAPTSAGAKSIGNTTILMSWSQPANSGSFIKNYIVYWGTVSGVYTNNSGLLPAMPRLYTISGLTPGTAYFWVVQAVAFSGCNSAVSSEKSATTTGSLVPTLLTNLVGYWKLDEASNADRVDSTGNGETLTDTNANTPAQPALINNGVTMPVGGSATEILTHADDANLGIGAGKSFTISCWFNAATHDCPIITKWDTGNAAHQDYRVYVGPAGNFGNGFFWFSIRDTGGVVRDLVSNVQSSMAFHYVAAGYDDALGQMWIQVDNGVRVSQSVAGVQRTAAPFVVGNYANGSTFGGQVDEVGFWTRSLSTTDISKLYNAGTGIQYPFAGAAAGAVGTTLSLFISNWWNTLVYPNSGDASNNGGAVSGATLIALDSFYLGMNSAGLLASVLSVNAIVPDNIGAAMWPLCVANGALPANHWTNVSNGFTSADLSVNGLVGANLKYIDTGLQDSTLFPAVSNCGMSAYSFTDVNESAYLGGLLVTDLTTGLLLRSNSGGNARFDSYDGGISGVSIGAGFYSGSRTGANAAALYAASSAHAFAALATSVAGTTKPFQAVNVYVMDINANNNTPLPGLYTTRRVSFVALHKGLTSAQTQALYNLVQALRTSLGGGFV